MSLRSLTFDVFFKANTSGIGAMNSATDKLKTNMSSATASMNADSENFTKSAKSRAATLGGVYKKQGMDASAAMKQAWAETERDAKKAGAAGKNAFFGLGNSASGAGSSVSGLTGKIMGVVTAVGLVAGASAVMNLSDTYSQTSSRINLMNDGLQTNKELQDKMYAAALDTHTAYGLTADAVSKLGITTGAAFSSSSEIVDFVGQLNKQFKIGGTSIEGQSAATLQLTQAMASGVLRGDELNSIYENAPTLIKSMADYMGVPVEKMRGLAEQGLITTDVIKNGVLGASEKTNAQFETMGTTFGQVWTDFKTRATQAFQPAIEKMNELSNSEGFKTFMDNTINALATMGPALVGFVSGIVDIFNNPAVQNFASGVIGAIGTIINVLTPAAPVLFGIATALGVWAIATGVMTAVQWALNAALTANPIGIIIMAIVAMVAAVVYLWNTNAAFRDGMIGIWNAIVGAFQTAVTGIQTAWGAVVAFFQGVWNGIVMVFSAVVGFFVGIYQAEWNGIMTIWNGAVGFFSGIVSGIGGAFSGVSGFITGAFDGAMQFMSELPGKFLQWGGDMIAGLIQGVKDKVSGAVDAIQGVATGISDAFKSFFNINSPSKLMREYGAYLPQGVALGIADGMVNVDQATSMATNRTAEGFATKGTLAVGNSGGQNITFQTTIEVKVSGNADATAIVNDIGDAWETRMENYVKKLGFRNPPQYV